MQIRVASGPAGTYLNYRRRNRRNTVAAIVSTATLSRPLLLAALAGAVLLAATLGLWAYYGTAIFFEMVRAGWMACF